MERELKAKEQLIKQAEVDLNVIKGALEKEKEILKEKVKAFGVGEAVEETKSVEELKSTKEFLSKAHEDLETKISALNEELEKVKVPKVSTKNCS